MKKTNKEVALKQIKLQNEIQDAGFNIVTCGDCGTTLIHKVGKKSIDCVCGSRKIDISNCPDIWHDVFW
jgi:hypothetical protein